MGITYGDTLDPLPPETYLLAQNASSGSLTGPDDDHLTLTLNNVRNYVSIFSDRPYRDAYVMSNLMFYQKWPDMFGIDPPNAALSYAIPESNKTHKTRDLEISHDLTDSWMQSQEAREISQARPFTIIVTLSNPSYDPVKNQVTYTAKRILKTPILFVNDPVPIVIPTIPNPKRMLNPTLTIDYIT